MGLFNIEESKELTQESFERLGWNTFDATKNPMARLYANKVLKIMSTMGIMDPHITSPLELEPHYYNVLRFRYDAQSSKYNYISFIFAIKIKDAKEYLIFTINEYYSFQYSFSPESKKIDEQIKSDVAEIFNDVCREIPSVENEIQLCLLVDLLEGKLNGLMEGEYWKEKGLRIVKNNGGPYCV